MIALHVDGVLRQLGRFSMIHDLSTGLAKTSLGAYVHACMEKTKWT